MEKKRKLHRWFVLLCAHVCLVIFGGTYRSLGVFLVEWRKYFDASSTRISSIITVTAASGLLSGVPSGIVINKYGSHYGILLGAIAFVSGTFTSIFAPNPIVLCFTTGFLTGLGVGPVRDSAIVAIAQAFNKGFSRANGVTMAGASVGMMLVPPILQLCMDQYGWRGALLILVGIQLHMLIVVLVFRQSHRRNTSKDDKTKSTTVVRHRGSENVEHELEPLRDSQGDDSTIRPEVITHYSSAENTSQSLDNEKQHEAKLNLTDEIQANDHVDVNSDDPTDRDGIQRTAINHDELTTEHDYQCSEQTPKIPNSDLGEVSQNITKESDFVFKDDVTVANDGNLPPHQHSGFKEDELLMNLTDEVSTDEPYEEGPSEPYTSARCLARIQQGLNSSGLSLFCNNVGFCLFNLCQIMIGLCYTGILTHLVASAVYDGINQQSASFLLSVFGISNLISQLCNGWVVDLRVLSPEHLYVLGMVIFGATMIVSRAWSTYGWYVVVSILFGVSGGLFRALNPVVLKRYVGMNYFARAIGVFYASTGAGDLIGPVFTGALYDASNSYDLPFYVGGSILIVSSGLLLLEPPLRRLKERRQAKSNMEPNGAAV